MNAPVTGAHAPSIATHTALLPAYYVFLDESGNFDFTPSGSKYLTLCGVGMTRPFAVEAALSNVRFDLIESGLEIERFHATEDLQVVRNAVFAEIARHLPSLRIDSIIVEKRKANPSLRPIEKFYPKMLSILVGYIVSGLNLASYSQVIVIADQIPERAKAKAVKGATKVALKAKLGAQPYQVLHHESRSCLGLQIADYATWAIQRKWAGDPRSYQPISSAVRSEFDVFARGDGTVYY